MIELNEAQSATLARLIRSHPAASYDGCSAQIATTVGGVANVRLRGRQGEGREVDVAGILLTDGTFEQR
jgi:hypothetical protein